jgi:threonine/homoserine/homoserine lactone efflux protein
MRDVRELCQSHKVLSAVVTFVPAAALLVIAPGPDSLLVLRNAARGGRRAGLATAAGTVTGLLVWAAAAALGLAALVRASQIGYLAVRWAGQRIWCYSARRAGHGGQPPAR